MATTGHHLFEGHRLAYETYGEGKRAVVLIHGLMMTRRMQEPLAKALARAGNACVTVDLVGHGESDKPLYNWDIPRYAEAIDSLIEALGFDQAVLIGTSLGANITLQVANNHPEHVRGMVVEMPALENAMIGGPLFFGPFAAIGEYAAPVARVLSRGVRLLPEFALPFGANILLDLARRDPKDTTNVLKGLFYGPLAPSQDERRALNQPALVIGHRYDPIHPFNDAKDLAELLPDAELIEATSIAELRLTPERITKQVIDFVDRCWGPQVVGKPKSSATRPPRRRSTPRRRRTS